MELENVTLIDSLGHKLLDGVSLSIPAGKRTAIVSSDGRGPLALAGLLARFFDPQTGRVLFDGRDIRNATLDTVRAQTALVAAGGMLFTDSVEENVRRGDSSIAPLRVAEAVKRVQAESMVERLPQGLATIIGPGGLALPADVVFRLVLARALLRDPSLLVVEEAPAEPGRDAAAETDGAVEEAVAGRTVIAFPARLSTLRSADNVLRVPGRAAGRSRVPQRAVAAQRALSPSELHPVQRFPRRGLDVQAADLAFRRHVG